LKRAIDRPRRADLPGGGIIFLEHGVERQRTTANRKGSNYCRTDGEPCQRSR
jgi:hypothetical protein